MKETSMNIRGFRKYQFIQYTNGNYNLDIVGDNKCVVTASPKLWTALTSGQDDSYSHIKKIIELTDKNREKGRLGKSDNVYSLVDERGYISSIISSDLDPSSASYLSMNDLVSNPDLLNDDIRALIRDDYASAPNHVASAIDSYLQSKYESVGMVITKDGDYKICKIGNFFDVVIDNDAFYEIIKRYDERIKIGGRGIYVSADEIFSKEIIKSNGAFKNLEILFKKSSDELSRGSYSSDNNIIKIY
jgi:hypothetical protein